MLQGVLLDLAPVVLRPVDRSPPPRRSSPSPTSTGVDLHPGTNLGADPLGADLRHGATTSTGRPGRHRARAARRPRRRRRRGRPARTGRHRRPGARRRDRGRRGAARADRGGLHGRGRRGADRVPPRRHRRAVPHDRQAARRSPAVGAGAGALRRPGRGASMRQHAVTWRPMMSKYDPWVNMLRGTVAAFAAGAGGAEAVTVIPFDEPLGLPDALGRRIARNTSSLLISESHVARVADPAGGSYAVEKLTDDLARAALGGAPPDRGAPAALGRPDDGSLLGRIEEVAAARDGRSRTRRRPLTGVSEFPNLGETLPERAVAPTATSAATARPSRRCATSRPARRSSSPPWARSPRTPPARPSPPTCSPPAGSPSTVAGPTDGVESVLAAYAGAAGGLPGRHRCGVRRVGRRRRRRPARGGSHARDHRRQADRRGRRQRAHGRGRARVPHPDERRRSA